MDLAGGVLNYEGIELLRRCENGGQKHKRTLLPSAGSLKKVAAMVEEFGNKKIPFHMIQNTKDGAEGFIFRPADMIREIVKGRNAVGIAKEDNLMMAQTLDGATLTSYDNHTMAGIKFNDKSNPLTSSRNDVSPLLCVIGGETKANVRGIFSVLFSEIAEAATTLVPMLLGILAIWIVTNCDMSCEWKLCGCGGATKKANFPCTKCPIHSNNLHLAATDEPETCNWCQTMGHLNDPDWVCRHHRMFTPKHCQTMQREVDAFEKQLPENVKEVETIWDECQIVNGKDPRILPIPSEKTDPTCIHFDVRRADRPTRNQYTRRLTNDLKERGMSLSGSIEERQERLKTQMILEWVYHDSLKALKKFGHKNATSALVLMMDLVPCILHMEIRMGIKILTLCFKQGITNAKQGLLSWQKDEDKTSDKRAAEAYRDVIEDLVSTTIFGTERNIAKWDFPLNRKTKQVDKVVLGNMQVRSMLQHFPKLVELSVADPIEKDKWTRGVAHYSEAMKRLRSREDMTDAEIFDFQKEVDLFLKEWIDLHQAEGVTNYAHMLGSGHIMEYLFHWRNLAIHSQQGWEGKKQWIGQE